MATVKIKDVEYEIKFCATCRDIVIICPECKNTSCNAGGCDSCHYAFTNSRKYLEATSIPGELCFKMYSALNTDINDLCEERYKLYKRIRHIEKIKREGEEPEGEEPDVKI